MGPRLNIIIKRFENVKNVIAVSGSKGVGPDHWPKYMRINS